MKLITAPSVYVLGRQAVDETELDRFLSDHGLSWESDSEVGAEVLCETAGRTCYMSFARPRPGGNAAYLHHIKEVGHGSVLEHAVWNLLFTGVSRSLTHELVRHRAGFGFSQLSQRYVDESVAEYVVPPDLREEVAAAVAYMNDEEGVGHWGVDKIERHLDPMSRNWDLSDAVTAGLWWLRSVEVAHADYCRLSEYLTRKRTPAAFKDENESWSADMTVDQMANRLRPETRTAVRKFARQAARSVLPNATETKIFVTANARALRHFLEQRGSAFAEPEIRRLANVLLDVLRKESRNLFGDYRLEPLPDGTFEVTTEHRKV